jgi:ankyrin repeat protein
MFGSVLQAALELGHLKAGYTQIAQRLLEQGADVNAKGRFYGTALAIASGYGNEQIVQQPLKQGADFNAQGSRKYGNALQQAAAGGHDQIVQWLLERGAEVNTQGCQQYCSTLQAASTRGIIKFFSGCLRKGRMSIRRVGGVAARYRQLQTMVITNWSNDY